MSPSPQGRVGTKRKILYSLPYKTSPSPQGRVGTVAQAIVYYDPITSPSPQGRVGTQVEEREEKVDTDVAVPSRSGRDKAKFGFLVAIWVKRRRWLQ